LVVGIERIEETKKRKNKMKIVNMRGSHWNLSHELISKEGRDDVIRHYLKTTVNYKNESGEDCESFSRIPIDNDFFPAEDTTSKKSFDSFDCLKSITDVLKDGEFDMDSIQRDAAVGKKQHVEWKIIPSMYDGDDNDKRVLVLGGHKGDSVWFDRRGSQSRDGRSVIVAYSQAYDSPSNEGEKMEGKRIIKEVQFAALLDDGDCVAYFVTRNGRRSVIAFCNVGGKIVPVTRTPYAWNQELVKKGLVKMPYDKRIAPRKNSISVKEVAPVEENEVEASEAETSEET
jgi:hypothetical protein